MYFTTVGSHPKVNDLHSCLHFECNPPSAKMNASQTRILDTFSETFKGFTACDVVKKKKEVSCLKLNINTALQLFQYVAKLEASLPISSVMR